MKRYSHLRAGPAAILAAALLLSACENGPVDRRTQGQVIGGVAGAALGATVGGGTGRVVATGAGAVLGTIVGGAVAER